LRIARATLDGTHHIMSGAPGPGIGGGGIG
jgi:hypothetical protein